MLAPHNRAVAQLSEEEGISQATLYGWRKAARAQGRLMPDSDQRSDDWTSQDKFAAVVETAQLNEAQLGEYCRKRGLHPEQLAQWRRACEQANDWDREQDRRDKAASKTERERVKALERELARKEKALAETAALLVLRKKANAIWGEGEDE